MNSVKRVAVGAELLLISPAALFMAALFLRNMQPLRYELAGAAHTIVMWYAGRPWTLWVLLIALPLAVLVSGSVMLLEWHREEEPNGARRTPPATLLVALATLTAGVVLLIVVRHMLAN
ncbi:MAG: hypothetical protein JWN34_6359 [Bryobacterales bacterium]|jgi:hypothetical protein|nr:hypothetical protein [Bryobacterales bacterium]